LTPLSIQLSKVVPSYFVIFKMAVVLLFLIIFFISQLPVILIMPFFAFLAFVFQRTLILTLIPT